MDPERDTALASQSSFQYLVCLILGRIFFRRVSQGRVCNVLRLTFPSWTFFVFLPGYYFFLYRRILYVPNYAGRYAPPPNPPDFTVSLTAGFSKTFSQSPLIIVCRMFERKRQSSNGFVFFLVLAFPPPTFPLRVFFHGRRLSPRACTEARASFPFPPPSTGPPPAVVTGL